MPKIWQNLKNITQSLSNMDPRDASASKKPNRNFLVMLKIFISVLRNTLWRNYNSQIYSLHLILWLQRFCWRQNIPQRTWIKYSFNLLWMNDKREIWVLDIFCNNRVTFSFFFQNWYRWTFSHFHKENRLSLF